jgi:lipopolysaccharide export system protein LptA
MGAGHREVLPLMASPYHRLNLPLVFMVTAAVLATLFLFNGHERRKAAKARMKISRTEILDAAQDQRLQKFSLAGFDESGKKFWNLEGETAKIDPGQTVYLENDVTLRLKDNTVITTDRVQWSQDRSTLTTDSRVFVKHEQADIDGSGALGRPNENFVQLNRNITMKLANGAVVTCDGPMKIFYNENKMIFYRNVKVRDSRGVLSAKRMDVFFEKEGKKGVEKIIAIGSVVIERGTDTTHSRRAIYTPSTGSLRLEGSPEITMHKTPVGLVDAAPRN